jgi:hypothetical protein
VAEVDRAVSVGQGAGDENLAREACHSVNNFGRMGRFYTIQLHRAKDSG